MGYDVSYDESCDIFSFSYKYIVGSVLSSTETRHIEYKTGGYAIKNLDLVIIIKLIKYMWVWFLHLARQEIWISFLELWWWDTSVGSNGQRSVIVTTITSSPNF